MSRTAAGIGKFSSVALVSRFLRKRGEATESEITAVKTDAYNDINTYLSQLSGSSVKSVKDIVVYNVKNAGTEGGEPGDTPAFRSGQVNAPVRPTELAGR